MKRISALLLICLNSCYKCPPYQTTDLGKLSKEDIKSVPYENDKTYSFKHSKGHIIKFKAKHKLEDITTSCDHCCNIVYKYQTNTITLTPNYPILDINFITDNNIENTIRMTNQEQSTFQRMPKSG